MSVSVKRLSLLALVALLCLAAQLAFTHASHAQAGGAYSITSSVISGGGGMSIAGGQRLGGTIGQATANGALSGGAFTLASGFVPASINSVGISGIVTQSGAPLAGIHISLTGNATGDATTNADGAYSFPNLAPGNYTVTPDSPGYAFTPGSASANVTNRNLKRDFTAVSLTCTAPPTGMVLWLAGDSDATDFAGSNNGVLAGGAAFRAGVVGAGFDLDGVDDIVSVPDAPTLNPGTDSFTVEAWVRADNFDGGYRAVVNKYTGEAGTAGWSLAKNSEDRWELRLYSASGTSVIIISDNDVTPNLTYHLAFVVNRAGNFARMYVNGVLQSDQPNLGAFGSMANSAPLRIGRVQANDPNAYQAFDGLIDEVRIFNRQLDTFDVQTIYQAGAAGNCKPVRLPPVADTWAQGAEAFRDTNYGASTEMQIKRTLNPGAGRGRRGFLSFDTSGITGNVTSARLRFFAKTSVADLTNVPMRLQKVTSTTWDELTLTWNLQPAVASPNALAPDINVVNNVGAWYDFDLTAFIQQERAAGQTAVSFRLTNSVPTGNNGTFYTIINSGEATENRPQLVIKQ